ncbi:MAG: sensor histidine kinase [Planctomycetaceae bacterium]|jgi:signal transduction histidine kinase|nr:sensor histidine kinase [Planctomycetaceae bacterium]
MAQKKESQEEIIAKLKQRLVMSEQMAVLGELTGTTTHEFNNILMTIINYAKLGLRHTDEASRTKSFDKILTAANRAAKVTQTILGMARNRKSDFEPTQLATLVEDTLLLLEREMNKYRVSVEKYFRQVPEIPANGNKIQQVLINMLINARQAMPNGGRLVLKLDFEQESNMVVLTIRDYGTGIPSDRLPLIFEPHYSTKDAPDETGRGGTGLGLSVCREIVESHHGKIRVESTLGKGTAFILRFPAVFVKPSSVGIPASAAMLTPLEWSGQTEITPY